MDNIENSLVNGAQDEYEKQFQGQEASEIESSDLPALNLQSFFEGLADIIGPPTPEESAQVMRALCNGVEWMDIMASAKYINTPEKVAHYSGLMTQYANKLGMMLIAQTIKNGYTAKHLENFK